MEFKKLTTTNQSQMSVVKGGKGDFSTAPAQMGKQAALPQAISMLQGLYQSYGLQFPDINMQDPAFKEKVVAVGKVAEVARLNTKALAQMLKHTATLMAGQVKLAEFYAASTNIVIEGKKRLDKSTADAFLALADYNKHAQSLTAKVDRKVKALDAKYELMGQLGEGKLKTSLQLIENQKQAGEKRQAATAELQQTRQELLASVGIKRQKDAEYIRYGHLKSDK
ncbi:hypothetical protein B4U84_30180 [Westiellopsis prolifica IICB1]|nr:hypothetical protein B4U84_30180 [Westiellopsis prolifica IICB1]